VTTTESKPDTGGDGPLPGRRRRVVGALRSPSGEVIPHPALDYPVDESAPEGRRGLDFVVFGVTAAIAVAFLVWGFISTPSLKSVSGSAPSRWDATARNPSSRRCRGSR
jgi:hypothetical protein